MLKPPVNAHDHTSGSENGAVTLVEYGDYQCPHCGHAYPIIKRIQKEAGEGLRFVFRNFPLSEAHPDAFNAALAAEAAARQDKFWEMHDIIFENQDDLSIDALVGYAKSLGMDTKQFAADIADKVISDKVDNDFESGIKSGVNGTPTFFINGARFDGDWEGRELVDALNEAGEKK
jgi:protein-disulfide isomerase